MRTIKIIFAVPQENEDDYADACADLVVEDFFTPTIGFSVIEDSASQQAVAADAEGRCKKCKNFVKSIYHNYCANCGKELPHLDL